MDRLPSMKPIHVSSLASQQQGSLLSSSLTSERSHTLYEAAIADCRPDREQRAPKAIKLLYFDIQGTIPALTFVIVVVSIRPSGPIAQ